MKILEYGEKGRPAVLLIHGMGCTGNKSFDSTIELLKGEYRVILPLLDGYDGGGTKFTTIEAQAKQLATFVNAHYTYGLFAVLGMSMGGFIALELLLEYPIEVKKLILDSGYLNPMRFPRLVAECVSRGFRSLIRGRNSIIVRLGMKKVMGFCFQREHLCMDATKETIYNSELSCLTYALPELPGRLYGCDIEYWVGRWEKHMLAGMRALKKRLPQMRYVDMGPVGHGEIMFTEPRKYARLVHESLQKIA